MGQSIIEGILLFAAIVSALVFFASFIRSSVAFRVKQGADSFGHGRQFEPAECAGSTAVLCIKRSP